MDFDIVILGLGPAGATIARLLAHRFKIVAIDKKVKESGGFQKPCGGLLSEDAQKSLSKFNLTLPKDILVDPQIFSVKTLDVDQNLVQHYQRFYVNLDRHKFDMWLISLIPENVKIEENSVCTDISKKEDKYVLKYMKNKEEKIVTAKYLIGADGANSLVRKFLYPNKKIRNYLSIQEWFEDKNLRPFYSCVFDSTITDSYCWSISKDGVFIFGGAFPIKDGKRKYEEIKMKLEKAGFVFGTVLKKEACQVLRPEKFSDFCTGKENAFLVGEAGGFISPSSLEGFSYALDTALLLAETLAEKKMETGFGKNINRNYHNRNYHKRTLKIRLKLFLKIFKLPFMYQPFLRKLVVKTGIKGINIVNMNDFY